MRWIWISACLALGACKSAEPMSSGGTDANRSVVHRHSGTPVTASIRTGNAVSREQTRGAVRSGSAPLFTSASDPSTNHARDPIPCATVADTPAATANAIPNDLGGDRGRTNRAMQSIPTSDKQSVNEPPPSVPLSSRADFQHTNGRIPAVTVSIPSGRSSPAESVREDIPAPLPIGRSAGFRVARDPSLVAPMQVPPLSHCTLAVEAPAQSLLLFSRESASSRNASAPVAVVALPFVPAGQNRVGEAGERLALPSPGTNRQDATTRGPPLEIPQWVSGTESSNRPRESEADRRLREQQNREDQFNRLRRAFYGFLSVNADD